MPVTTQPLVSERPAGSAGEAAQETIAPTAAPLAGFSGTRRVPPATNEPNGTP